MFDDKSSSAPRAPGTKRTGCVDNHLQRWRQGSLSTPRTALADPEKTGVAPRNQPWPESTLALIGSAFASSYSARKALNDVIIPELPAKRQQFAGDVVRRLSGPSMLDECAVCDLDTLIDYVNECIELHTEVFWQYDEHHVDEGYELRLRDSVADALGSASIELVNLRDSLLRALSEMSAVRVLFDIG